jgi:hypothetical protein
MADAGDGGRGEGARPPPPVRRARVLAREPRGTPALARPALARPALPVGLAVLATLGGGERVRATIVAATARREHVLIEERLAAQSAAARARTAVALADAHAASELVAASEHAVRQRAAAGRAPAAGAPAAGGPSRREVHVSQLMPVASDVPVPPFAVEQPVPALDLPCACALCLCLCLCLCLVLVPCA